ncbi:hypothetical protein P153DRAFT_352587 [Dothidotthia symphoricarpi CBS 119687]|uniref:Uncharacterized protein n=1 Tax=Dothidotthia symphoricarpi CBS 119687 TaxID=1392245 RepID=A0A6A6ASR6_9PLEO|nr:uncharacterized protein P153DRAFT_352587 [Dothidotthia symphoricarpi CBS 119687]KAF2134616.1 hypothetical protein P153DRAFT_352587 [Dothidotthia symphoricarpi CBS 119687]
MGEQTFGHEVHIREHVCGAGEVGGEVAGVDVADGKEEWNEYDGDDTERRNGVGDEFDEWDEDGGDERKKIIGDEFVEWNDSLGEAAVVDGEVGNGNIMGDGSPP